MKSLQAASRPQRRWADYGTHLLMVSVPVLYALAFTTPFVGMVLTVNPIL